MFTIRTTKPEAGNKFYNNGENGGYSWCIEGYPTDRGCNVLSNCVGYACGRFNEIIGSMKYKTLCCNAENFIERAKAAGLEVGMTPKPGAIMCWQRGATLGGRDGAGHVAIVEKVIDNNCVYTSESGYGSNAFWNSYRKNNNGRWGLGNNYTFRGFIYNPAIKDEPERILKFKVGDKVYLKGNLFVNSTTNIPNGYENGRATVVTRANGTIHPYNTTGDLGWCDESSLTPYVEPTFKIGDKVKIKQGAKDSNRGTYFASWVYNGIFVVMNIDNNGNIGFGNGTAYTGETTPDNLIKM